MNTDWHQLIQDHLAGLASEEETRRLEMALLEDAELRTLYLDYSNLDMSLESGAKAAAALEEAKLFSERPRPLKQGWFSRPLSSIAAGIVIGILTSSLVWAYTGKRFPAETRIPIPLQDPSFEELSTPLQPVRPRSLNRWVGDPTHQVTSVTQSVRPRLGKSMVKMSPVDARNRSRFEQIVEIGHLVPEGGGRLEFTASFLTDGAVDPSRYTLKVWAYDLPGSVIAGTKEDIIDLVICQADRTFVIPPGSSEWRPGKVRMDLPAGIQTVAFGISAVDLPETSKTASRYVDAIKASIVVSDAPST